jgi:hypothetical protein
MDTKEFERRRRQYRNATGEGSIIKRAKARRERHNKSIKRGGTVQSWDETDGFTQGLYIGCILLMLAIGIVGGIAIFELVAWMFRAVFAVG